MYWRTFFSGEVTEKGRPRLGTSITKPPNITTPLRRTAYIQKERETDTSGIPPGFYRAAQQCLLDTPFVKIRTSFEAEGGGGRRLSIVGPRGKYRYSKYYTTSGLE